MPEEFYMVSRTRLVGIANQVRRLSGSTEELTLEQMESILAGIESRPNVEDPANPEQTQGTEERL